jgi:DNA-binding transcriptional LysR family regulator
MPIPNLLGMFPKIKAKKVQVIHEWALPDNPGYYELDFDAIVCFDHRYKTMLLERYPEEKIHIIPYPCHPYATGNKEKAREKLGLPKDALILFSFGRQPLTEYGDYLWLANELGKKYNLIYLVVRSDNPSDSEVVGKTLRRQSSFCEVRFERPLIDRVCDYLHASDIHLIPKGVSSNIVVSSTVFQCLGSGTPIVIPDTRYVEEEMDKEVVKYRPNDRAHLKMQILRLIEEENLRKATVKAAEKYVRENSAQKIAEKFMALFLSL